MFSEKEDQRRPGCSSNRGAQQQEAENRRREGRAECAFGEGKGQIDSQNGEGQGQHASGMHRRSRIVLQTRIIG